MKPTLPPVPDWIAAWQMPRRLVDVPAATLRRLGVPEAEEAPVRRPPPPLAHAPSGPARPGPPARESTPAGARARPGTGPRAPSAPPAIASQPLLTPR